MFVLRIMAFAVLSYLSLGIIVAWYKGIIYRQQFTYIPFVGGILGCVALYVNPFYELDWFVLMPLFIDYFSFPYFIHLLIKKIVSHK